MNYERSMSKSEWKKGPPPSMGWWPASASECLYEYRWWDGEYWSWSVYECDRISNIEHYARKRERDRQQLMIKWMPRPDNWPERSRT